MNILYVSRACPNELYKQLSHKPSQAATKFNYLVAKGFAKNGHFVKCCYVDKFDKHIRKNTTSFRTYQDSQHSNLSFMVRNYNNVGGLSPFKGLFQTIKLYWNSMNEKDSVLVCDYLCYIQSMLALIVAKLKGRKTVCICTDLPQDVAGNQSSLLGRIKQSIFSFVGNFVLNRFRYYVLLTKQMNEKLSKHAAKRPFVVIEGLVDSDMSSVENNLQDKDKKRILIYAGSLHKIYGIKELTEGFLQANIGNVELHIYGSGDFNNELEEICKTTDQIKYFGVVSNEEIIQKQLKATLLVNPRPTNEEYTKYSFPSKNMEYMVSGTPVLTTKLPGMPNDYLEYVYTIDNESSFGIAEILKQLLLKDECEVHAKGIRAKEYVLNEKNEVQQSKKIIALINERG
ncbi:glycosyltransferase [Paludicola sp. MB14-C6]|uniref:glycosyltransferase n=1 Tax=Paludihabitans sp. MB14-C6 TaxID=3070656 RepID=UPI0027DB3D79|nr:glycosyltransferase [Paludicola sp. MB14-C6]WMJ22939.1 glycosyltransferase [Paludicola sp. MB14-C6]